jgi:DNA gyrase subunit A
MIINKSGVTIRLALSEVRVQGRNTQGVSLINLKKRNDVISSVCRVEHEEPEEEVATDVAEAGEEASPNASEGGKVPTNE